VQLKQAREIFSRSSKEAISSCYSSREHIDKVLEADLVPLGCRLDLKKVKLSTIPLKVFYNPEVDKVRDEEM
jgi:hypothetical protein